MSAAGTYTYLPEIKSEFAHELCGRNNAAEMAADARIAYRHIYIEAVMSSCPDPSLFCQRLRRSKHGPEVRNAQD